MSSASNRRTYVIVGAGIAGGTAALALRRAGFDGRLVLIGDEIHPPYSRPPLSKGVLRGELVPEKAHLRPPKVWDANDVELRLGSAAVSIDVRSSIVALADGSTIAYDKLLLTVGGVPRRLPGTDGIAAVRTLRTLDDALALRDHLAAGRSLAVVGAGFIGAEVAASAIKLGGEITVLEALPLPLARVLPPVLGEAYARLHRARGVDLRTDVQVREVRRDGTAATITDADGRRVRVEAVIAAIGLELDLALARTAGLAIDNGIVVDELCRTSVDGIYAAGDVTNHPNRLLGRRVRIEHWQNAQHQAAAAARSMLGEGEPFAEVPWVWSEQYEYNLQVAGLPHASDRIVLRGQVEEMEFAAFLLRGGTLAAVIGINRPDEVRAARALIARGVTPSDGELADPRVDLRTLLEARVPVSA